MIDGLTNGEQGGQGGEGGGGACVGAMAGGSTSPASSECDITRAPSSRVLTPQEVAQTCVAELSAPWKVTSNAWAQYTPDGMRATIGGLGSRRGRGVGDVRLGKILPKKVRGAALQGPAILHQGLDGVRVLCASESLGGRLNALHHWDRKHLAAYLRTSWGEEP